MKSIFIPSHKGHDIDKLYDLLKMTGDFLSLNKSSDYIDNTLLFHEELKHAINEQNEILANKIELIAKTLGKYWKVSEVSEDGSLKELMYIYPYRFCKSNDTLFALTTRIDDTYEQCGSMCSEGFRLYDETMFDYDLQFDEVTQEEFVEYAQTKCATVLKNRVEKETNTRLSSRMWICSPPPSE